jgi:hypothetical protein
VPHVGGVVQPGSYAGSRLRATESNSDALKRAQKAGAALRRTTLFGLWSRRPRVRVPSLTPFPLQVALFLLVAERRGGLRGDEIVAQRRGPFRAVEPNRFGAGPPGLWTRGPRHRALTRLDSTAANSYVCDIGGTSRFRGPDPWPLQTPGAPRTPDRTLLGTRPELVNLQLAAPPTSTRHAAGRVAACGPRAPRQPRPAPRRAHPLLPRSMPTLRGVATPRSQSEPPGGGW